MMLEAAPDGAPLFVVVVFDSLLVLDSFLSGDLPSGKRMLFVHLDWVVWLQRIVFCRLSTFDSFSFSFVF